MQLRVFARGSIYSISAKAFRLSIKLRNFCIVYAILEISAKSEAHTHQNRIKFRYRTYSDRVTMWKLDRKPSKVCTPLSTYSGATCPPYRFVVTVWAKANARLTNGRPKVQVLLGQPNPPHCISLRITRDYKNRIKHSFYSYQPSFNVTDALNEGMMRMSERHLEEIYAREDNYGSDDAESLELMGARHEYERAQYWDRYWKDYRHCIPD